ncbi:MAG: 6-bladed beta-propeller [Balneolia bacterium]|nr:6-bladed beta-propeller [Balneolia bacterium]
MHTFNRPLVLLLILVFCLACSSDFEDNLPEDLLTYEVHTLDAEPVSIARLTSEVSYIPFILPDDVQLQGVRKVIFSDDRIYLLDMSATGSQSRIFVFDDAGNYVFSIDRHGRGPGEYEYIYDLGITEEHIIIVTQSNFLYFDRSDGNYLRTVRNRFDDTSVQWVHFFNDDLAVAEGGRGRANRSMHHIKYLDIPSNSIIHEAVPFPSHAIIIAHSYRVLFETEQGLRSRPVNSNVVYSIEMESDSLAVEPLYRFEFGELWIPESFLRTSFRNMNEIFTERTHEQYIHTTDVFETDDILYVSYMYENESYVYIYDKQKELALNVSRFEDNHISWPMLPMTTSADWIAGVVYPFEIEDDHSTLDPALQEILSNSNDDGDPILVLAKFSLGGLE